MNPLHPLLVSTTKLRIRHRAASWFQQNGTKVKEAFFFIYFADRASQYIYLNTNQLDALNFIMSLFMPLHISSTCAHRQEVKIVLYSLWYQNL